MSTTDRKERTGAGTPGSKEQRELAAARQARWRWRSAAGITIVSIAAVACGGDGGSADSSPPAEALVSQAADAATAGLTGAGAADSATEEAIAQELPLDFSISLYQGEELLGGTEVMFSHVVAQGKPVVLNFWAGLCIPCRAEMASLQDAYEKFGDQVLLFGLDVGLLTGFGERKHALDLLALVGTSYPAGSSHQPELIRKYRAMGIPSTFFIKPDGSVFQTWNGFMRRGQLTELIEELIDASI